MSIVSLFYALIVLAENLRYNIIKGAATMRFRAENEEGR